LFESQGTVYIETSKHLENNKKSSAFVKYVKNAENFVKKLSFSGYFPRKDVYLSLFLIGPQ
jgi:hypothetical protein